MIVWEDWLTISFILIVASSLFWRSHHPLKKPWPPRITAYHNDCNVVPDLHMEGKPGNWTITVKCQP